MTILVIGVAIFIGVHLVPTFSSFRSGLIDRIGAGPYKGLFSLGALLGLVLMVVGFGRAEFVPVWQPPSWGRHVPQVLMFPSFVLLAGANMRSNLKRFVRHPMLLGICLWSVGHLFANGDQASVILFGGLGGFALFDMWSANRRRALDSIQRVAFKFDVILLAAGAVAYIALALLHPFLFGVAVLF